MFKCNWISKLADKASKVVSNLGKAKVVYVDDKGVTKVDYLCLSEEEAVNVMKNAGCKLITYNNRVV